MLSLSLAIPCLADTFEVGPGRAFEDLQVAIDSAQSGDTLEVYPGRYEGFFEIRDKNLTIQSTQGSSQTTLAPPPLTDPWLPPVLAVTDATVILSGLTIDGEHTTGGFYVGYADVQAQDIHILGGPGSWLTHLYVEYSTFTLSDATIEATVDSTGQHAGIESSVARLTRVSFIKGHSGGGGGALNVWRSDIDIVECTFSRSSADREGGAIFIEGYGHTTSISKTLFEGNTSGLYGGAVLQYGGSMSVVGSTFRGNSAEIDSGAIDLTGGDQLTVDGSTFEDNTSAGYGAGASSYNTAYALIRASTFQGNSAGFGGAVIVYGDGVDADILGNTFCGDSASDSGGAIWSETYGSLSMTIANNTFLGTSAAQGGGAIGMQSTSAVLSQNTFAGVRSEADRGALWLGSWSQATLVNNALAFSEGTALALEGYGSSLSAEYTLLYGNDRDRLGLGDTETDVDADPAFASYVPDLCSSDLHPGKGSALLDAGDPSRDDDDGTRSDIGAYGGPGASILVDVDGDGVITDDCDLFDPTASLPSEELAADGLDQDCDGSDLCYVDGDGDGLGSVEIAPSLPTDPPCADGGVSAQATDCDDTDPLLALDCAAPEEPEVTEEPEPELLPPSWFCSHLPSDGGGRPLIAPLIAGLLLARSRITAPRAARRAR